jgi:membrane protein involved in colicin uptake
MPVISITQEMQDRGKTPEKGWSPAILEDTREQKAKTGDSINYFFEFQLTGGPEKKEDNNGRYQTFMVNSAGLSKGLGMEDFNRMIAALLEIKPSEVKPDDYDTDKFKGKQCWVKIDMQTVDGKLKSYISDFSSYSEIPFD